MAGKFIKIKTSSLCKPPGHVGLFLYNTTSEEDLHLKMNLHLTKSLGPIIRKYIGQRNRLKYTMGMKSVKFIPQKNLSIVSWFLQWTNARKNMVR